MRRWLVVLMVLMGGCAANQKVFPTPEKAFQDASGKSNVSLETHKLATMGDGTENYEALIDGKMYRASCQQEKCTVYYAQEIIPEKKAPTGNTSPGPGQPSGSSPPSYTPSYSDGPNCKTGCRCGNACISCAKKCSK